MSIEDRLKAIEDRNETVTIDKKWETSLTRRSLIVFITYTCGCFLFLYILPNDNWYIAAIVPVCGYVLSTLSLPWARNLWESRTLK